jgi:hypothetical protein
MVYFLDNDVILKLTAYGITNEALECLKIERSNIRVLDSARFVFGSKKLKKKYSETVLLFATEFVKQCTTISSKDSNEHKLLVEQDGIDLGEATLITAIIQESGSFLATGDKRCLQALATTECLQTIHKSLQGRVVCLEQIICKLIETQGFDWVLEKILLNLECDKAIKVAFGSGSRSQCESVLGTLNSYIQELRVESGGILVESMTV